MSKDNDLDLPKVFLLDMIMTTRLFWWEEMMPYLEIIRGQYICQNKKWLKENMEDNPAHDGLQKHYYLVTEYWSGFPMNRPAQRKLIKDYGSGIKRQIDKADFWDEEEGGRIYRQLKKSRQFNPGDIVWFLYEDRIYTGIVYGKFWESKSPDTATPTCFDIEKRTNFHKSLETYTVMVLEHEDGPSFYYPDRLEILEKPEEGFLKNGENEYFDYIVRLREFYDKLKGKLTPEGEPKEPEI